MLMPKRVKYRREHRGKMRGEAKGGKKSHSVNLVSRLSNHLGSLTAKSKLHVFP